MADENQDNLESENQDNGGETVDQETTAKDDGQDYKQIAQDQRKRAEIAEAKLKDKPKTETQSTNSPPAADADELRLIAKGLSDEEIEQAKVIAKGTGKNLVEAIKSPLFTAFQKELKEQERKDKAKLSASKGSNQEQTVSISDMSRDDHQKLAMQAAQNIQ